MLFILLPLLPVLLLSNSILDQVMAQPLQEIWYHTGYPGDVKGPPTGMSALTGPTKMPAIFEAIWRHRLLPGHQIHTDSPSVIGRAPPAPPIDLSSLRRVHTDRYLRALFTGEPLHLALSQGLPVWNDRIAKGWLLNVGGLYEAARIAVQKKTITANLGHGYHHATFHRGSGFCTINGLVVVSHKLIWEGQAKKIMILDLDHHEGNGTGECVLGYPSIWNVTLFGAPMGGPPRAENHHPFHVLHGAFDEGMKRDVHYLVTISSLLPPLIKEQDPDLILYQAGMDPYDSAGMSAKALAIRDAYVFSLCRTLGKPVTWVLAGGYAPIETLIQLHTETLKVANEVLIKVQLGDQIEHHGKNAYEWSVKKGKIQFPDWRSILKDTPQIEQPPSLSATQWKEFIAHRERLFREEKLPDEEIQSAYQRLLSRSSYPVSDLRSTRIARYLP